ncbi:MAG: glycosyltransferase family 2 protein [Planctomycetota bacterium]
MLNQEPRVGIIILNLERADDTIECLSSLKELCYDNCAVVLADNGSSRECLEKILRAHPETAVFRNADNLGFAAGSNLAIRHCIDELRCDYVLLLNNDVVVDAGMLRHMVSTAESRPDAAAVGAKICFYDRPNIINHVGGVMDDSTALGAHVGYNEEDYGRYEDTIEADYVTGAAMLISAETISRAGLFDEDYFYYYEDADWCARAGALGYRMLVNPKAKAWHKIGRTAGEMGTLYAETRNRPLYILKNFPENMPVFEPRYIEDVQKGIRERVAKGQTMQAAAVWMGFEDFCTGVLGRGRIDVARQMNELSPLPLDANGQRTLRAAETMGRQAFRNRLLSQFRNGLRRGLCEMRKNPEPEYIG